MLSGKVLWVSRGRVVVRLLKWGVLAQEVDVEALPSNWDGAGSSVHRGGSRIWADASHAGAAAFRPGSPSSKGGSQSGHGGWPSVVTGVAISHPGAPDGSMRLAGPSMARGV